MENKMEKYSDEMEMGEFLGDMHRGLSHVRVGIWLLVILELSKFILW
jgi:hypothetical protein